MGLRRANTANASRSDRSPERIKRQNSSGGGAQSCNPYEEASGAQRLEAQRYQIPRKAVPQRQPDAPLRPLYLPAEVLARQQQQEIHQRRLRQRRLDMADFRRAMQERNEQSGSPDPSPSPPDLGYQRVQLVDIPTLQKLTSYNELRDPNDSDDEYVQMSRRAAAATAANAAQAAAAAPRARSRPRSYTAPAAITNTATSNTATANTATAGEREWRKSELAGPAGVHRWASSAVKAKGPSRGKTRIADTGNSSSSSTDDDSPLRLDGALRPGAGLGPVPSQFFHEAIDAWSGAGPAATKPKGNWI